MLVYYFFIKIVFFFMLVRTLIKFEVMQDHWLFLGVLYTAGVAFISYVFIMSYQTPPWNIWFQRAGAAVGVSPWVAWLGATFLLSTFYFKLLTRFDEGVIFWTLLLLGTLVVLF